MNSRLWNKAKRLTMKCLESSQFPKGRNWKPRRTVNTLSSTWLSIPWLLCLSNCTLASLLVNPRLMLLTSSRILTSVWQNVPTPFTILLCPVSKASTSTLPSTWHQWAPNCVWNSVWSTAHPCSVRTGYLATASWSPCNSVYFRMESVNWQVSGTPQLKTMPKSMKKWSYAKIIAKTKRR